MKFLGNLGKLGKAPLFYVAVVLLVLGFLWQYNFFAGIPAGFPRGLILEKRIKVTEHYTKDGVVFVFYDSRAGVEELLNRYEKFLSDNGYEALLPPRTTTLSDGNTVGVFEARKEDYLLDFTGFITGPQKSRVGIAYGLVPEARNLVLPDGFPADLLPNNATVRVTSAQELPPESGEINYSISAIADKNIFEVRDFYLNLFKVQGWVVEGKKEETGYIWIRAVKDKNAVATNIVDYQGNKTSLGILYGSTE